MAEQETNVYSFTTTEQDAYLDRVIEEASPEVDFILTTQHNTVTGERNRATLLFRRGIVCLAGLVPFDAKLTLGRTPLIDLLEKIATPDSNPYEWVELEIEADSEELDEELINLRNEIRRLTNILTGRVIRVNVESF
jgi:hypothetical protein